MIAHQIFAQIYEETVNNICVCENYELANYISRATYGNTAFAVECTQYPCSIGDKYRNGIFYHVNEDTGIETEIVYLPTTEQETEMLKSNAQIDDEYLLELDLRLSLFELGL